MATTMLFVWPRLTVWVVVTACPFSFSTGAGEPTGATYVTRTDGKALASTAWIRDPAATADAGRRTAQERRG